MSGRCWRAWLAWLATGTVAAAVAAAAPAVGAGAGAAARIEVVSAVALATPPGAPTAAVYLHLRNRSAQADQLVKVATPASAEAMVHEQSLEGGVMRMRMAGRLAIAAGGELAMHAGGTHVMLMGLSRPLVAGGHFSLQLQFARAGALDVEVKVLPLGSQP